MLSSDPGVQVQPVREAEVAATVQGLLAAAGTLVAGSQQHLHRPLNNRPSEPVLAENAATGARWRLGRLRRSPPTVVGPLRGDDAARRSRRFFSPTDWLAAGPLTGSPWRRAVERKNRPRGKLLTRLNLAGEPPPSHWGRLRRRRKKRGRSAGRRRRSLLLPEPLDARRKLDRGACDTTRPV